jgi:polyisoprenoid-binding protein YceI
MGFKSALVLLGCVLAAPAVGAQETYVIDPSHSASNFEVEHLSITWIRGRFNKMSGTIMVDRAAKNGTIRAEIDAASVDTGHARRDELLRTENYFNTTEFPTLVFQSDNLRFKEDALVGVDGDLTMLGVKRPVHLLVTTFKCIIHPVNKRDICGAVVHGAIKRSDFGMTRASRSLSDEIRIYINIEAIKN